jgi:hypothetical protein
MELPSAMSQVAAWEPASVLMQSKGAAMGPETHGKMRVCLFGVAGQRAIIGSEPCGTSE